MQGPTRRTLLAAAGAAVLAGCARPAVNVTRPTASPTGSVAAQLDQIMQTYARNTVNGQLLLGMAVKDLQTGHTWDFHGDWASQSASMAKVMIAAMTLRQARAEGHALDPAHQKTLSDMLINSDNDAADALWSYAGGPDAYQKLAAELGMTQTRRDTARPDWSWTWTTPKDQLVLLDRLLDGTPALTQDDRLYELDVMGKTNPAQIWGVGHFRSGTVHVSMKNGWVQFGTGQYPGLWCVNTMGHVRGEGRNYTAAIMCRQPTFEAGKALLDAIGSDLYKVMGSGAL